MIPGTKKFSVTTAHATTAVATQAAPGSGKRLFVTDIAASTDKSAVLELIEDLAGTPIVKFVIQVNTAFATHSFITPIQITANKSATVRIHGTSACKANIAGLITSH